MKLGRVRPWGTRLINQCSSIEISALAVDLDGIIFKSRRLTMYSGVLWQGSNSKIENYGFLAAVTLFEKVYSHFWHVDAISHYTDNGLVF